MNSREHGEEGREQTVEGTAVLEKDYQRIEHLGLTLTETTPILKQLQPLLPTHPVAAFLEARSRCEACGVPLRIKDQPTRTFRTLAAANPRQDPQSRIGCHVQALVSGYAGGGSSGGALIPSFSMLSLFRQSLRNYLKTMSKQVYDTKVEYKQIGSMQDSFLLSSHSALESPDTSTARPAFFLLPSAVLEVSSCVSYPAAFHRCGGCDQDSRA